MEIGPNDDDGGGSGDYASGYEPDNPLKAREKLQDTNEFWTNEYMEKLSHPYKRAVYLHYVDGCTYPQIAEALQCPINTAKSYVHRGMKQLEIFADKDAAQSTQRKNRSYKQIVLGEKDISKIPKRFREVVRMRCIDGYSYAEIAQRSQIPLGTVKSYINRGMKYFPEEDRN